MVGSPSREKHFLGALVGDDQLGSLIGKRQKRRRHADIRSRGKAPERCTNWRGPEETYVSGVGVADLGRHVDGEWRDKSSPGRRTNGVRR